MLYKILTSQRPCLIFFGGKGMSKAALVAPHVRNTSNCVEAVQQGPVNIAAEISKQVDECPSNGYLLDSSIQVRRFVSCFFFHATAATW